MSQPPEEPQDAAPVEPDETQALLEVDLETVLRRRRSPQKRVVLTSLMVASLVVILLTFWEIAPRGSSIPPAPVQPTPFPDALSIASNVNYGTVSVNGRVETSSLAHTIKLHGKGSYRITLAAPPFRPLTCTFPAPTLSGPTSGIIGYTSGYTPCLVGGRYSAGQESVNVLEMLFTLADLPPEQQQQIASVIPEELTAEQSISVPARTTIVTGLMPDGQIASASFPGQLNATAVLVPSRLDNLGGSGCQGYVCTDSGLFIVNGSMSGQYWEVSVPTSLRWLVTGASGQTVSNVTFPSAGMLTVYLAETAGVGWTLALVTPALLTQDLTEMVCPAGQTMLAGEASRFTGQGFWGATTLQDKGLQGCLLDLQLNEVDEGHFIWRFGALLAVDAKAHHTLPELPTATPEDLAALSA